MDGDNKWKGKVGRTVKGMESRERLWERGREEKRESKCMSEEEKKRKKEGYGKRREAKIKNWKEGEEARKEKREDLGKE